MTASLNAPLWDSQLIARYDLTGPRYTSYPTAPQFYSAFSQADWQAAMARSNASGRPLSLYVHIPFCNTVCYYCGCNKIITANKARALPYLQALHREIALQAAAVNPLRPVVQVHFGGGTPTYLSDEQLSALMAQLRAHFHFNHAENTELSIEIHPQTVTPERLNHLRQLGFNRLSLGVQDFNPQVQTAVNRFNCYEEVAALMAAAKALEFASVSVDLIYGLPLQTEATFKKTLDQIIQLRPHRLSLFSYAHLPHLFKSQQHINAADLPSSATKLALLEMSIQQLQAAGYVYIGMDHFALPEDDLTRAQQQGQLHRNFQGYSTQGGCDLLAFGVSAINQLDNTYAQNAKDMPQYLQALEANHLPIVRGFTLSAEDQLRKALIGELICLFECDIPAFEQRHQITFASHFANELKQLAPLVADGLVRITPHQIQVTPQGRLFIRRVCMAFDAYLKPEQESIRYSKII